MGDVLEQAQSWWEALGRTASIESQASLWLIAFGLLLGALLAMKPAYRLTRHVVTFTHEGGHALVGLITGRKLAGIKLHTDSSGVTTTVGPPGLKRVPTSFAGYPAPAITAGLLLMAVLSGNSVIAVTIAAALTAVLLAFTRNVWGFIVTLLILAGFIALLRWLPVGLVPLFVSAAAGLLGVGAFRDLFNERRARSKSMTDVRSIGIALNVPAWFVWLVMLFAIVAGLAFPPALVLI